MDALRQFTLYQRRDASTPDRAAARVQAIQLTERLILIYPDATAGNQLLTQTGVPGDYLLMVVTGPVDRFGQGLYLMAQAKFERLWERVTV